ncbi:hypothetical protein M407DRAFT_130556 [Tulasnella calospora MUT 4182]|uniref:Uncharacterized protein n=1 Tax=Tulasnella calospora MUT 4182 TaxID=1051891 RepID=A0A0C3Q979_9AGAM|nr:hypothetical protein M407DRAFT_130556 [Tulasnella calospora MUT 4182]
MAILLPIRFPFFFSSSSLRTKSFSYLFYPVFLPSVCLLYHHCCRNHPRFHPLMRSRHMLSYVSCSISYGCNFHQLPLRIIRICSFPHVCLFSVQQSFSCPLVFSRILFLPIVSSSTLIKGNTRAIKPYWD